MSPCVFPTRTAHVRSADEALAGHRPRRVSVAAVAMALAVGMSGCGHVIYALDPEMKAAVEARKAEDPAPTPTPPGAPPKAPLDKITGPATLPGSSPTAGDLAAAPAADEAALNAIAERYVRLSLEIGTHEEGYIDAYYGDPSWKADAVRAPRDRRALLAAVRALRAELAFSRPDGSDALLARRVPFLDGQLMAAETRLLMMDGARFSFIDEARRLFGVTPALEPLSAYDPILTRIEQLVPGKGALSDRVDRLLDRTRIPADNLRPVIDAAIARCRARTARHIALPPGERFALTFVTGKPWSGYNWYEGGFASRIEINTDLPVRLDSAVNLACHEGYPGHHLLNALLEQRLVSGRGWAEFSVYPLYSPQSLVAEGTAQHGIDLAFPGPDRAAFERDALAVLAGVDERAAADAHALNGLVSELQGARLTIAQQLLDGAIDRATAIRLTQRYLLLSAARAEQSVRFTETYRSYVVNYGLGRSMVAATINAGGADEAARWRRMQSLLTQPTVPADLAPPALLPGSGT